MRTRTGSCLHRAENIFATTQRARLASTDSRSTWLKAASLFIVPTVPLCGSCRRVNVKKFSLSFNTNFLTFVSARLGADAAGAVLNVNARDAALGRVGLALALSADEAFAPGLAVVAEICFRAVDGTNPGADRGHSWATGPSRAKS